MNAHVQYEENMLTFKVVHEQFLLCRGQLLLPSTLFIFLVAKVGVMRTFHGNIFDVITHG